MSDIPKGYCQCGCGQKTKIAPRTHNKYGWKKGEPFNFILGHQNSNRKAEKSSSWKGGRKISSHGYVLVHCPEHPKSHKDYVYEHILIAEKALGKYLPDKSIVHHHNSEQLVVCQDISYHMLLHRRKTALQKCGNAGWRKCQFCQKYDEPKNMYSPDKGTSYHRKCRNEKLKEKSRNGLVK